MINMTMIIAIKNDEETIIMTADKRLTTSDLNGKILHQTDDYKKTLVIADRFILSFAGKVKIVEIALEYINDRISNNLDTIEVINVFKEAFLKGKQTFNQLFPTVKSDVVFYLGYLNEGKATLVGFSSDNDFEGVELDATIKLNSQSIKDESVLIENTYTFISKEIQIKQGTIRTYEELTDIYFSAIHRIDDSNIGKTGTSIVLTPLGIVEYNH